ncbi:hypothetical protein [Neisseria dentiae]|uniref:hypothetical protein n=1 Tax=Neisseria dentiae TaxID=194197 RepID=UPI0035A05B0B
MPGFSEKESKKTACGRSVKRAILQENTFVEMIYFRRPETLQKCRQPRKEAHHADCLLSVAHSAKNAAPFRVNTALTSGRLKNPAAAQIDRSCEKADNPTPFPFLFQTA